MPRVPNIIRNLDRAAQEGFKLVDDRGNPLNVPINSLPPTGIYRTSVSSNNPTNVMVKVKSKQGDVYPMGFTPEEAFYVRGTQSINPKTGMNVEMGDIQTGVGLKNNTGVNKIARTDMSWSPENASPLDGKPGGNQFAMTKQSLPDTKNTYGKGSVSQGFTNPLFYVNNKENLNTIPGLTDLPKEFGDHPNNLKPNFNKNSPIKSDPNIINKKKAEIAKNFTYNIDGKRVGTSEQEHTFIHNLDRQIPTEGENNAYLASYVQTSEINGKTDNEDPTMFGYDIKIKFSTSPLFNGSIINFINQFSNDTEIEERRNIWVTFCNQFFKFFKIDMRGQLDNYNLETYNKNYPDKIPNQSEEQIDNSKQIGNYAAPRSVETSTPENYKKLSDVSVVSDSQRRGLYGVKTYYLKKISGLENLVEKNVSSNSDSVKSMIDYGKDIIKLSLYEDVTINTGYLAMLYKSLSWSRLNGKQVIPENLLRFDVDITITEIRNYNRVFKATGDNLSVYADKLSKYTYTLYDCQFMFNEMSHAGEIDMSEKKFTDDFDISFNYKYSNLSFDKFILGTTQSMYKFSIDNSKENVSAPIESTAVKNPNTNNVEIGKNRKPVSLKKYDDYPNHDVTSSSNTEIEAMIEQNNKNIEDSYKNKWGDFISSEEPTLEIAKRNVTNKKLLDDLSNKLQRAAIGEVNRQITKQARLLNKTIDNIRNSIGVGRMSEPTNVYDNPKYQQLMSDTKNAFRDFVGQSVRGFFGA